MLNLNLYVDGIVNEVYAFFHVNIYYKMECYSFFHSSITNVSSYKYYFYKMFLASLMLIKHFMIFIWLKLTFQKKLWCLKYCENVKKETTRRLVWSLDKILEWKSRHLQFLIDFNPLQVFPRWCVSCHFYWLAVVHVRFLSGVQFNKFLLGV